MRVRHILVLALAGVLCACAGYSVQENGTGEGYDVYRPEPYLQREALVKNKKLVGYEFNVVWLPNYNKRYRVRSWTGFGASNIQFTFKDGWKLTGLVDQNDNTEVLKQLTGLTEHLVPKNPFDIALSATEADDHVNLAASTFEPTLYRIVYDDCGRPTCKVVKFKPGPCGVPGGDQ